MSERNHIRLSVCIATLNRGNLIGETLASIIAQANEEMEIVVVDGASTDNTETVIRGYQEQFPRLRYVRQDANRGIDQDYAYAVEIAAGEYCWLFSDDDLMKPGAIERVCNSLHGEYGLVIANAEVRTADLKGLLQARRLAATEDRTYGSTEGNLLLADTGAYLTFIGCVIIKKSLWNDRNKENYFGSQFVHVGVIFQSELPEDTLVIAEPLLSIRYGNATWLERYFEIWMFKWPQLIWSLSRYKEESRRAVCAREPWRSAAVLVLNRARDAYSLKMYQKWIEPRLESIWSRALAKGIALVPGTIANGLVVFYYSVSIWNPYRGVGLVDMRNSRFYFGNWGKKRTANVRPTPIASQFSSQ